MNQTAYFAAGCFWGVQSGFDSIPAVLETAVGYMGGEVKNPSYEDVCSGTTGHAEAVKVVFDSNKIDFLTLLEFFWHCHDPSQLNRQGLDVGTQYRSVIFCADEAQHKQAQASKEALAQTGQKVVTEIIPPPAPAFFVAEDYHQNYFAKQRK
jgi:peptide-methionine (S)-S-oxide reductase